MVRYLLNIQPDKKEKKMSKIKYRFVLVLAAVMALAGVVYIYFAHYAKYSPEHEQELSVWYVNDDAMWANFGAMCREFSSGEGEKLGIKVTPQAFASASELYAEVCRAHEDGDELPDMLVCGTDFAAYLDSEGVLADMDAYFGSWEASKYDKHMLTESKSDKGLAAVPIAAETNVFVVNTEKFPDAAAISSFEKLCSVAEEYYKRNGESFFSISDYSSFFRNAVAQLGDEFDGISPHETDNENCKYVYKLLAETAYDRGYYSANEKTAQLLADGTLTAAIVSSADLMKYASKLDGGQFDFVAFPYMKDGKAVYSQTVTGISILASEKSRERSAQMFIRWFSSAEVNSRFAGDSGYIAATGSAAEKSDYAVYGELMDAIDDLADSGERLECAADAKYSENSRNFDNVLITIMNSLS